MKLSKRIKQLLFGLVWGDAIVTTIVCVVKPRLGVLLALASVFVMLGIIITVLFWITYKSFVNEEF